MHRIKKLNWFPIIKLLSDVSIYLSYSFYFICTLSLFILVPKFEAPSQQHPISDSYYKFWLYGVIHSILEMGWWGFRMCIYIHTDIYIRAQPLNLHGWPASRFYIPDSDWTSPCHSLQHLRSDSSHKIYLSPCLTLPFSSGCGKRASQRCPFIKI